MRLAAHLALFHAGDEPLLLRCGNAESESGVEVAESSVAPGGWHWHFLPWNDLDGDGERDPRSQDLALSGGVSGPLSSHGLDCGREWSRLQLTGLDGPSAAAATLFRAAIDLFASSAAGARRQFRSGVDVRRLACVCVC